MYQGVVHLPNTAPVGSYQVDLVATHPGYEPDRATFFFFVAPVLSLTLTTSQDMINMQDTLTLMAQVSDRGTVIADAGVWAEIGTPGGIVALPLMIGTGGAYGLAFRPIDLGANLGGRVLPGMWLIRVMADYQGGEAAIQETVTVQGSVYLPLVLRQCP